MRRAHRSTTRAEAQQLQAEIDANGQKIDALSEKANGARYRLTQAQAAADAAQQRMDAAQAEADRIKRLVNERSLRLYEGAGASDPLEALDVRNTTELAARGQYASIAANRDSALADQLKSSKLDLAAQKQQYEQTKQQAQAEQDSITASTQQIEAANAKQKQILSQVKGELATLVEQDKQRQQAAALARAQRLVTPRRSDSSGGGSAGASAPRVPRDLPAPSGGAAAAIAFAEAQLGKPYVYAAAGPDAYDCSGLTMRAWQAAGISMPHYSGAQFAMFPQIPLSALQPGDLVYWGPGGSEHVAMYVGGGQVISAPHTGDVVRIMAIWDSPSGANRPG